MKSELMCFDRFEFYAPVDEIREMYRTNNFDRLIVLTKKYAQLALQHRFVSDPALADAFAVDYILYIQRKSKIRPALHPVSYRKGYTFRVKHRSI